MRSNLEPGDTACDGRSKLVAVKINNEERINLPFTSYVFDRDHFVISNFRHNPMNSVLTNLSQGLQLKLEKAGGDYKLALVNDSGQYYHFYYHDPNTVKIATFDSIPSNFIEYRDQEYIYSYTEECSINLVPLIKSKVLIDPKDIMSSEDINLILKELESSPDKRLRISAGENFLISHNYKSVKIYNPSNNSIGILNNIAASSNDEKLLLSSRNATFVTDESDTGLKRTNPRFRIKRLNNDNYVGCILSEYGKCARFYALTPESFEQDEHLHLDYYDDYEDDSPSHSSHPYYYYLHGLEVSMNHKKLKI
ncbi:hypothetical protein [Wolbachia endosymbiont (group A) of Conops quadrifasciatus]|uniref:hypothetical protein n=1 Tax=Wolbachia endosymbiont (group A) of Conops quadrifasciatus TaxID=3066143 RepID=UPI003132A33A